MELIRNLDDADMGEVYWRLYRRYISLSTRNEADDVYVWRCARAFDELDDAVVERLCAASLRYRAVRLERLGESAEEVAPMRGVLERIEPGELIMPDLEQGDEVTTHLSLNCEWDREHGTERIIRGGEMLYVGPFHGEDPWRDLTAKEPQNYAWAEASTLGDDAHRADDARDVAEQGEQDVQPEGVVEADSQEHAQRRQEDGGEDVDQVHERSSLVQG